MMDIKVLGTGCTKCKHLEIRTNKAIEELNLDATVEKVEDIQKINELLVKKKKGLIINDEVVLSGQLPKVSELKKILSQKA